MLLSGTMVMSVFCGVKVEHTLDCPSYDLQYCAQCIDKVWRRCNGVTVICVGQPHTDVWPMAVKAEPSDCSCNAGTMSLGLAVCACLRGSVHA